MPVQRVRHQSAPRRERRLTAGATAHRPTGEGQDGHEWVPRAVGTPAGRELCADLEQRTCVWYQRAAPSKHCGSWEGVPGHGLPHVGHNVLWLR
jgi:hypothetical protein